MRGLGFSYLLLPFPLKLLLTPVTCEKDTTCPPVKKPECPPPPPPPCEQPKPEPRPCPPQPAVTLPNPGNYCRDEAKDPCAPKNSKYGEQVKWCEPRELSHKFLVRQACQLTVDSVTRVIGETMSAYQDYHVEYRCLLDSMMDALEDIRTASGTQAELLDCKLILIRARVDEMKRSIVELECFMSSIQKLSEATAETAYLGHAEYHSIAMSERMQSAMNQMASTREETLRKERDMIELQSVVIVESGNCLK